MELEWSESFKKKIELTIQEINGILKNSDNSIITLDFTFFFPTQENKTKWDILIYQYAPKEYVRLLKELYRENKNQFAKFADNTKVVRDLENNIDTSNLICEFQEPQEFAKQTLDAEDFTPEAWHRDLLIKKFGKTSIVVSREYRNDKYNYNILAGVYLILKEKFGCFSEDTYDNYGIERETKKSLDEIQGFDKEKMEVKRIWEILDTLLSREMFDIIISKLLEIEIEKEQLSLRRKQQRTINHYLRPIFTGISIKTKSIQSQIDQRRTDEANHTSKVLQLQAEILEHHFKLGQRLDDFAEQADSEKLNINFESFFRYLYIRNFITGFYIDPHSLRYLSNDEYKLVKEICTSSFHDLIERKKNDFNNIINALSSKLIETSSFKLIFKGNISNFFLELPNSLAAMNIVIKFSSTFIQNFKEHWMEDYISSVGDTLNSSLIIYANSNEVFFFQHKEIQGYNEYKIDFPNGIKDDDANRLIELYTSGFKEENEEQNLGYGVGNNDLKSLLLNNNINFLTYNKELEITYCEDGINNTKLGQFHFKKLSLKSSSTLIKLAQ